MHWLRITLGILLLLAAALALLQGLTPVYRFDDQPTPFRGKGWYNPFEGETLTWTRANFHIHSYAWGGLTNGHQSPAEIQRVYDSLGYRWVGIADYQRINPHSPIPLYEHGWSVGKVHQLCFWAEKVRWWDYPLYQSLSAKQHILKLLRPTTPFLVVAHPRFLHSYTGDELAKLGGYDAIEVLNRYGDSVAEWDSALSSGHYASILGSDNAHDVYNLHEVMSRWTEIALPSSASEESLRKALLVGRTVGYKNRTPFPLQSSEYPLFSRITMRGDSMLEVKTSMPVDSLRIVGQGGQVRSTAYQTDTLSYHPQAEDTYLRIEAFTKAVEAYTSPLIRGTQPKRRLIPPIDMRLTILQGVGWMLTSLFLILLGLRLLRTKYDKR
ncbi:MAG: hypothetical protein N3E49_00355 [Bacteroidia bacterium]|nr:hypothetical protein [Bacteroidia bacterium]